MLEAGTALSVLGNHEWNAFAFHLADPDAPGESLRRQDAKNRKQHEKTLEQVPSAELASHLAFFRGLPFRLDLDGVRVVHACWDDDAFKVIDEAYARHGGCTDAFVVEGSQKDSPLFAAVDAVLKGKEVALPDGIFFTDKDGHRRDAARVRWFESPEGQSIATYTLPRFPDLLNRAAMPISQEALAAARPYPADAPPVFFGHYWLDDARPMPLAANVSCIDYSVAKGGFLCGYRWGSEEAGLALDANGVIRQDRFVTLASGMGLMS